MNESRRSLPEKFGLAACAACLLLAFASAPAFGADEIELLSGARVTGTIVARDAKTVKMNVVISGRTLARTYPLSSVKAIVKNGVREDLAAGKPLPAAPAASSTPASRSNPRTAAPQSAAAEGETRRTRAEVEALIKQIGQTPPEWFDQTPLEFPDTLDLSFPQPPPPGWNNKKNVGQYIWDIVNPNPGKWREGVVLLHHVLKVNKDNRDVQVRAMQALGRMYFNLHEDYARAAFWWQTAGVHELNAGGGSAPHLAECYYRLGNKQMAVELLTKAGPSVHAIKAWADMGETNRALQMVETTRWNAAMEVIYANAADACRTAGRFRDALNYYQRILSIPATGNTKGRIERYHNFARANIEGINNFELCDLQRIADGNYRASSLGYEGQVEVEVAVSNQRIESVRVTQHREKQFYSALVDTPRKIIQKQSVKGIDTTSNATITSEAIINATAKALASGNK